MQKTMDETTKLSVARIVTTVNNITTDKNVTTAKKNWG